MADEALRAALQVPQEESPATYRELVESLITDAEINEAQERAWQRQRRSELRIAELEAREDVRAGSIRPGEGAKAVGGERGQDSSSSDNASPPAEEAPSNSQAPGYEVQARSLGVETAWSRKLQTLTAKPAERNKERSGSIHLDLGQKLGEMTTTETSEWESESESGSQAMMSAEDSRPDIFQSASSASETELAGRLSQYSPPPKSARIEVSRATDNQRPPRKPNKGLGMSDHSMVGSGHASPTDWDGPLRGPAADINNLDQSKVGITGSEKWTVEVDASRPQTPTSWEEVAREKSEQLEEAKRLLGAVMEGERAALETVARLELELQENRATISRKGPATSRNRGGVLKKEKDGQHADSKGDGVQKELQAAERSLQSPRASSSSSSDRTCNEYGGKNRRSVAASEASFDGAKSSPPTQANGLHDHEALLNGADDLEPKTAEGTLRELEAREAVYRSHCEVLQQQVRRALKQVELLRKQQKEKETRDLALYEGRLSAYVKQMVAVRRDKESLMAQQRALQDEKQHLQEQVEAEHQKRRDEFHATQAQVHTLSDSLSDVSEQALRCLLELRKVRNKFECNRDAQLANDGSDSGVVPSYRSKEEVSVKESVATCQQAMEQLETEVKEQLRALECAADVGKQLSDEKAYTARLQGERDRTEKLKQQFEAEAEKLSVEKKAMERSEERLKAQVVEMKNEHEKQVAALKEQLKQRESSLAQYKAVIHKELAGLSQHMHEAAAQRAREDAEFRGTIQKSENLLQQKDERISELEAEVKELRKEWTEETEVSAKVRRAYEEREREWGQKSQAERDGLEERLRDSKREVVRLQGLAASHEKSVAEFKEVTRELLGEKNMLEQKSMENDSHREAMKCQLERQQEELDWLKQKLDGAETRQWDEVRKEQLVAEVQGILEQYSVGEQLGMENFPAEGQTEDSGGEAVSERSTGSGRRNEGADIDVKGRQKKIDALRKDEAGARKELQIRVAQTWAEREGLLRTGVPEFERQEESIRSTYEAEIAALRENVRSLEEEKANVSSTSRESEKRQDSQRLETESMQEGTNARHESTEATAQGANMLEHTTERVKHSLDVGGLAQRSLRSSPEGRQSLDSGQSGAWSDKRLNEEDPSREGEEQRARVERDHLLAEKAAILAENGALKTKVSELHQVNQELQLRVKLLEEDRLKLLDKIASSPSHASSQEVDAGLRVQLAAVQAQLAEANAKAAEQKSRYKHLKGKYLRQLARQQAMQEYMIQGGDSPANLSPRSGVAPFVGRPGLAANNTNGPLGRSPLRTESVSRLGTETFNTCDVSLKGQGRNESDSRLGAWQESFGDLGPEQRQALVAQTKRTSNGHILRSTLFPRQASEAQDDHRSRGSDGTNGSRRSGQRQINGSDREHPAKADDVPERGPSSGNEHPAAPNRFHNQAFFRSSTVSSRSMSVGKGRSSHTTPAPSRRQSSNDSVLTQSGVPVGLRVLMDGRPLPGFPAKLEDLGGYFAEARAQVDGSRGARLPANRTSVPYLRRREDKRVSRASSAPPMRPSYNQSARVWV